MYIQYQIENTELEIWKMNFQGLFILTWPLLFVQIQARKYTNFILMLLSKLKTQKKIMSKTSA